MYCNWTELFGGFTEGWQEALETLGLGWLVGVAVSIWSICWLLSIAIEALAIVGQWFIYRKAKQHGWAAIVPFYSSFILYKITWGNGWYFLLELIPFANIVISIITMVKLSKAFGHGGGYACGLVFLPYVFLPILGFGKSEYVGLNEAV